VFREVTSFTVDAKLLKIKNVYFFQNLDHIDDVAESDNAVYKVNLSFGLLTILDLMNNILQIHLFLFLSEPANFCLFFVRVLLHLITRTHTTHTHTMGRTPLDV
jgi:hypothetical protein